MKPKVKICCIQSKAEAQLAIDFGADALGLVGAMPSGPGIISDSQIRKIAKSISSSVAFFLLTGETQAAGIIAHHQRTQTHTIQMVDALTPGSYNRIRNALPTIKLVQVIHVCDAAVIHRAIEVSESVDALLLDSGNPNAAIKTLGGIQAKPTIRIGVEKL